MKKILTTALAGMMLSTAAGATGFGSAPTNDPAFTARINNGQVEYTMTQAGLFNMYRHVFGVTRNFVATQTKNAIAADLLANKRDHVVGAYNHGVAVAESRADRAATNWSTTQVTNLNGSVTTRNNETRLTSVVESTAAVPNFGTNTNYQFEVNSAYGEANGGLDSFTAIIPNTIIDNHPACTSTCSTQYAFSELQGNPAFSAVINGIETTVQEIAEQSYAQGYEDGYTAGYNDGFVAGYSAAQNEVTN